MTYVHYSSESLLLNPSSLLLPTSVTPSHYHLFAIQSAAWRVKVNIAKGAHLTFTIRNLLRVQVGPLLFTSANALTMASVQTFQFRHFLVRLQSYRPHKSRLQRFHSKLSNRPDPLVQASFHNNLHSKPIAAPRPLALKRSSKPLDPVPNFSNITRVLIANNFIFNS